MVLGIYLTEHGQFKISNKGNNGWTGNTKKSMPRWRAKLGGLDQQWKADSLTLSGKMGGHDAIDVRKANRDGVIAGILISILLIVLYVLLFT
jgi:hypothetical protein